MITIDILELVDQLEALVNRGWHVPFTIKSLVDDNAFFDIIDQMRISVPQEIKRANDLLEDKEKVLAAAAQDAEHMAEEARERAARLLDEHEILAAARAEAATIKAQAQREAEAIRKGADDYALGVLSELESRIGSLLRTTANGLTALKRKHEQTTPGNPQQPS